MMTSPANHPHPKGTPRTAAQELRYGRALAYAWGRRDAANEAATGHPRDRDTGSVEFATFYSMLPTLSGHDRSIHGAWEYFRMLKREEQEAYHSEWMRPTFPGLYALTH
jgi:hypothetical protein